MPIKLIASDMDGTFLTANDMYNQARFERVLSEMTKRSFSSARTNVAVTISERFSNACSGR